MIFLVSWNCTFFHSSDQYAFVIVCKVVGWGEGGVQFAAKTTDAMVRFKSMYTDYFFFEKWSTLSLWIYLFSCLNLCKTLCGVKYKKTSHLIKKAYTFSHNILTASLWGSAARSFFCLGINPTILQWPTLVKNCNLYWIKDFWN